MSKLEELIEELCPDGVEYLTTNDVKEDSFWLMPATPNYIESGVPYITSKNVRNGKIDFTNVSYISQTDYESISANRSINVGDVLITMIGTIGEVCIVSDERDFYGQNLYLVRLDNSKILTKYYYYFITSVSVKNSLVTRKNASSQGYIKAGSIENLRFPIPPLPVQEEIVRILDKFTDITSELQAELQARAKQYEYYREQILDKNKDAEWVPLLDIADTFTGLTYKPSDVASEGTLVLRSSNIQNSRISYEDNVYVQMDKIPERSIVKENDILVCVRNGSKALIGKAAIIPYHTEKMAFGAFMTILRAKETVDYRYLFFVWQSPRIQNMIHGDSGMPINQITKKMLEQIKVPLPSLEKQKEIVNILDKFSMICIDIIDGLPAEIEARQKQYEYYRNKLLTFKELGA